jgi:hypothetical protein
MMVFGSGSYSTPSNNCGHTFTLATSLSGPQGTYNTGGDGTYLSLQYGSSWLDGYFLSNTNADGFCPVVSQTFYVGSMAGDTTINPWIKLESGTSAPTHFYGNTDPLHTTFTVSFIASLDAAGATIAIQPGVQITSGDLRLSDITSNPGNTNVTISGTSFTIEYSCGTQDRSGKIKPAVSVSSGTAEVRPMSPQTQLSSTEVSVN